MPISLAGRELYIVHSRVFSHEPQNVDTVLRFTQGSSAGTLAHQARVFTGSHSAAARLLWGRREPL